MVTRTVCRPCAGYQAGRGACTLTDTPQCQFGKGQAVTAAQWQTAAARHFRDWARITHCDTEAEIWINKRSGSGFTIRNVLVLLLVAAKPRRFANYLSRNERTQSEVQADSGRCSRDIPLQRKLA